MKRSIVIFAGLGIVGLLALSGCERPGVRQSEAKPQKIQPVVADSPPTSAAATSSGEAPSAPAVDPGSPASPAPLASADPMRIEIMPDKVVMSEEDWKAKLSPEQYYILRQKGTERAFTGKYWNTKEPGVYRCAGCDQPLFTSSDKFDSHCGWPSFDKPFANGIIAEHVDTTYGMIRTEVTCSRCGAHLGHVFDDGPTATGLRYCINSASIEHQRVETPPPSSSDLAKDSK